MITDASRRPTYPARNTELLFSEIDPERQKFSNALLASLGLLDQALIPGTFRSWGHD